VSCAEGQRVQAYFDGELEGAAATAVERHLSECAECRALYAQLQATRARLQRELPAIVAPPQLRARIARALDAENATTAAPPRARSTWRSRPFWQGAWSGAGVAALALGTVLFLLLPRPDPVLDAVVDAHVRALMSNHPTDVISTDRHTVKPWFAGRADVSPTVADFAAQGYRLIGGRADYLEHQRAAVLVYQHGAHVIDVFSWAAGHRALPQRASRDGYHETFWKVGDVQYGAVSDAGWDELFTLRRLLQQLAETEARE
jgi:anti-sigma factor RsiW